MTQFLSHLEACCCPLQGCDACSWGRAKSLAGVGAGRDLEDGAIANLPAVPGDPSHPHTCREGFEGFTGEGEPCGMCLE